MGFNPLDVVSPINPYSIGKQLPGLFNGQDGTSAPLTSAANPSLDRFQSQVNDPKVAWYLGQYAQNVPNSGVTGSDPANLKSLMEDAGRNLTPDQMANLQQQLSTHPATANHYMSQQLGMDQSLQSLVGTDPNSALSQSKNRMGELNSQFDKTGSLLDADREALMGRDQSYGLTDTDLAAYGQAAGNITRQFGAAENNLAQMLADRGLAAGPSGAAPQMYSGLLGSKNEQLANAQLQIAQNRINTAKGLAESRTNADLQRMSAINSASGINNSLMQGLGSLNEAAKQNQYSRNVGGAELGINTNLASAQLGMANQALQQDIANSQWAQEQSTRQPGLFESVRNGVVSGIGSGVSQGLSKGVATKTGGLFA